MRNVNSVGVMELVAFVKDNFHVSVEDLDITRENFRLCK